MAVAEQVLSRFPRHLDLDARGQGRRRARRARSRRRSRRRSARSARCGARTASARPSRSSTSSGSAASTASPRRFLGPLGRRTRLLGRSGDRGRRAASRSSGFEHDPADGARRRGRARPTTQPRGRASPPPCATPSRYDGFLDRRPRGARRRAELVLDRSGTVAGLLGATAAYLGLELDRRVSRDETGYWHLARAATASPSSCRRRRPAARCEPPHRRRTCSRSRRTRRTSPTAARSRAATPTSSRSSRLGFDAVPVTVIVVGTGDRTVHPMVVNVDDGEGVATIVDVPDGSKLRFERDGRVELDGASVARRSFRFHGAVFAARRPSQRLRVRRRGRRRDAFGDRAGAATP